MLKLIYATNIFYLLILSHRFGNWHKDKKNEISQKNVPRLIVFIMGGATYSEFRVGYEISNEKKNWEVIVGKLISHHIETDHQALFPKLYESSFGILRYIIGGSQILTPEGFLKNIKELSTSGTSGEEYNE